MAERMKQGLCGTLPTLTRLGNRESNWYSVNLQKQWQQRQSGCDSRERITSLLTGWRYSQVTQKLGSGCHRPRSQQSGCQYSAVCQRTLSAAQKGYNWTTNGWTQPLVPVPNIWRLVYCRTKAASVPELDTDWQFHENRFPIRVAELLFWARGRNRRWKKLFLAFGDFIF